MESATVKLPTVSATQPQTSVDTPSTIPARDSAALRRLMEEVRNDDSNRSSAFTDYDRVHNRHNR